MKMMAIGTAKAVALFCAAIAGLAIAHFVLIEEEWVFGALLVAGIIYYALQNDSAKSL